MVSSWLLVMPKIRRVWSGEKVVISNMLRRMDHGTHSAYSETTDATTEQPKSSSGTPATVRFSGLEPPPPSEEKIILKEEEAIPKSVEKEMYKLSRSIQAINNKRYVPRSKLKHVLYRLFKIVSTFLTCFTLFNLLQI
jgi:hypothetical protein